MWQKKDKPNKRKTGLKITRTGAAVIFVSLALGVAALNTGSNLLFLGVGASLSSILISGIWSAFALASVRLTHQDAQEVRAGEQASFKVCVQNIRTRMPVWGIEVAFAFENDTALMRAPVLMVQKAKSILDAHIRFTPRGRGYQKVTHFRTSTRFPFGFFEKYRHSGAKAETQVLILPKKIDVSHVALDLLSRLGDAPASRKGRGEEFHSLRAYRDGDDPKRILWRRAAKTKRKLVRENEEESTQSVVLHLCLSQKAHDETTIAFAGSFAEVLLHRGYAVGLEGPDVALAPQRGQVQSAQILRALALMNPQKAPQILSLRGARIALCSRGVNVNNAFERVIHVEEHV